MKKAFIIFLVVGGLVVLSIVGCKLLSRLDGRGQYVCDNHGHVVDEKDYPKKIMEFEKTNGCFNWTYSYEGKVREEKK